MSSCPSLPHHPPSAVRNTTPWVALQPTEHNNPQNNKKVANTNTDKDNDNDKDTDKHKCKTLSDSKLLNPTKKNSPVCRMNRQRRTQIQVQKDELRFSISNDSSYINSLWKKSTFKLLNIYMISFPFNFRSFLQLVHNQWWKKVSLDEFYHFSCNKDFQSFTAKLIQRKCAFWIRWLSEQNNLKLIFWEDNRNFHN